MATYSNPHWLLAHIRNSFISTDDTGICETVMVSDDLAKHYLLKFESAAPPAHPPAQQQNKASSLNGGGPKQQAQRLWDAPLQEVDFMCYPGLDQSDDEDIDLTSQSFDIQMYPEVGAHRFRSNTAQKLEKMDIARRKAARTKCVNFDDEIVPPERSDFFVRKTVTPMTVKADSASAITTKLNSSTDEEENGVKSKLSLQLANSPKQAQNKFMEYARFDGTSQTGIQTKRINVFLAMLPERESRFPIKICVLASAKIVEVIGLICYKATIQYPELPLKSIRHYALYMTEDNDDLEDFPPLDNREPCSKFGFSYLKLAERRPLVPVTRIDYNVVTKSMTSEEDRARLAAAAVRSLQSIELNGGVSAEEEHSSIIVPAEAEEEQINDYEERMLSHNDMLEAPMYRTYRLNIIDKRFFKTEVTLGISGERVEIDHHKNSKFWTKQKSVTYPIETIAMCEIVERRHLKATLRIWVKAFSSSSGNASSQFASGTGASASNVSGSIGIPTASGDGGAAANIAHSPSSPGIQAQMSSSPFSFLTAAAHQPHMRFKHYDFEVDVATAEQIYNKLHCILKVRSSIVRREFMLLRERKLEKSLSKKHLKL